MWRYMSLSKLIWTIRTQSLYFIRVNKLKDVDPYECTLPEELRLAYDASEAVQRSVLGSLGGSKFALNQLEYRYVNCWHLNRTESLAMWKLYASENGVALISSVDRFENTLRFAHPGDLSIETVWYYDLDQPQKIPPNLAASPHLIKHSSLSHEQEARLSFRAPYWTDKHPTGGPPPADDYMLGKFDFGSVVEEIRVSPLADPWLADTINEILSKFDLPGVCKPSSLRCV